MNQLLDVVAVGITDGIIKWVYTPHGETAMDAEAAINMAIMRQGVDTQFYTTVPRGTRVAGDKLMSDLTRKD